MRIIIIPSLSILLFSYTVNAEGKEKKGGDKIELNQKRIKSLDK